MQKFKVCTLSLSGHSNKVFQSQDIVTVKDFPSEENVLQHVLTGGLWPLNEDGSPMERQVITQELIDGMTEEQRHLFLKAEIVIKPGMYAYVSAGIKNEDPETIKHIVSTEDLVNHPEWVEQGIKEGDEIDIPAPDAPTDKKSGTAPKTSNKKNNTAKK